MQAQLEKLLNQDPKSAQCVLVFPKAFEEQQFLASLTDLDFAIQEDIEGKFNFNLIHWEAIGSVLAIQTVCLDASDVLFTASLVELINHKQRMGTNLKLILCGTCGADASVKIGDCFEIQEALKIDRGDMYLEGGGTRVHIELRPQMRVALKPNHVSFHQTATAICSNYLVHASPSDLYRAATGLGSNQLVVADMETFEFFMICEKTKVNEYRALRVVSDTAYKNHDKKDEDKKNVRKRIPMQSLVLMVNRLVSEQLATGQSYAYTDHFKQRILRSAKVRFEGIPRPDFTAALAYYGAERVVDMAQQWPTFKEGLKDSRKLFDDVPDSFKFAPQQLLEEARSREGGANLGRFLNGIRRDGNQTNEDALSRLRRDGNRPNRANDDFSHLMIGGINSSSTGGQTRGQLDVIAENTQGNQAEGLARLLVDVLANPPGQPKVAPLRMVMPEGKSD